jgi:hypothetical protein
MVAKNRERRSRRSANVLKALQYLLDTLCTRYNLVSLVLGDDQGLLVAGSSPLLDAEELAARAPLIDRAVLDSDFKGWPLRVWKARTGNDTLQFCGVGKEKALAAATLHGGQAVRRILA